MIALYNLLSHVCFFFIRSPRSPSFCLRLELCLWWHQGIKSIFSAYVQPSIHQVTIRETSIIWPFAQSRHRLLLLYTCQSLLFVCSPMFVLTHSVYIIWSEIFITFFRQKQENCHWQIFLSLDALMLKKHIRFLILFPPPSETLCFNSCLFKASNLNNQSTLILHSVSENDSEQYHQWS